MQFKSYRKNDEELCKSGTIQRQLANLQRSPLDSLWAPGIFWDDIFPAQTYRMTHYGATEVTSYSRHSGFFVTYLTHASRNVCGGLFQGRVRFTTHMQNPPCTASCEENERPKGC